MNNLGGFLEKFAKYFQNAKSEKAAVIAAIEKATNIRLEEKEFEVKNYTITLTTSPAVKSELFMYKKAILEELKAILGNKAPTEMR